MSVDSNTNWLVKVFPWGRFPPENAFPSNLSLPQSTLGDLFGSFVSAPPPDLATPPPYLLPGISSISISRSKYSPAGFCNITVHGEMLSPMRIGDWLIVYSINDIAPNDLNTIQNQDFISANPNGVPRFYGQVKTVRTDYQRDEKGTLRRVHSISVIEWSSFLTVPVRYDTFSIVQNTISDNGSPTGFLAATLSNIDSDEAGVLLKIANTALSAFQTAQLILKMIDAISSKHVEQEVGKFNIGLPDVAIRLPAIPDQLLGALQIPALKPELPFSGGMVTVVTGVQQDGIHNEGDWNGVWDYQEFSSLPTNTNLIEQNPSDRPLTFGLSPMFSQGLSAWDLLQNHTDSDINEFFTDITYEYSSDGTQILPRPFIWVRDKPFAMKILLDKKTDTANNWTLYDDLPRLFIDEQFIMQASFEMSTDNVYNYIRLNFNPQDVGDPYFARVASENFGINNRQAEQVRFGGKEKYVNTSFVAADPGTGQGDKSPIGNLVSVAADGGNAPWFQKLKNVIDCWYGSLYRMGSGTLSLKDHNVALTVGFNLQFKMGATWLVGHIDGVAIQTQIDPGGHRSTNYQVQLSRIVTINDEGDLDFLPPDTFRSLRQS